MTQPNPDQGGQQNDPAKSAKAAPKVKVGDVVRYTRQDPILRGTHRGVGVVSAVDDQGVEVRPLAHHTVRVDPADITTAGDAA